jgi:hypothetical protein
LAWIATFALCFISYIIVRLIVQFRGTVTSAFNFDAGCDILYTTQQLSTWHSSLSTADNYGYLNCYCNYNYFKPTYTDSNMR